MGIKMPDLFGYVQDSLFRDRFGEKFIDNNVLCG